MPEKYKKNTMMRLPGREKVNPIHQCDSRASRHQSMASNTLMHSVAR